MIRVLICDDQDIIRKGLSIILNHNDGIEVVGLGSNGEEGVEQAALLKPDVVLMDLKMPILNGIHATRRIRDSLPETRVLILTTYDGDDWVFDAIRAGANGYLLKDADGDEIVTAVRETAAGKSIIDPQIAGKILAQFNQLEAKPLKPAKQPNAPQLESLTKRELAILNLMAQGQTNQQIADNLFLAVGTIKNNVSHIIGKLQVNDRTQAVIAALKQGIVDLQ